MKNAYGRLLSLGIIGVCISLLFYFTKEQHPSPQQLYSRYNQVYPIKGRPYMKGAQRALFLYRKEEYEMASNAFQRLLEQNPQHPAYLFYKGQSDMQAGWYTKAIKAFDKVLAQDTLQNRFNPEARWYVALCSLQTDSTSRSRKLLGRISQNGGMYAERADDLLTSLKQRAKSKEGEGE